MHKLLINWNVQCWLISRNLADCTARLSSKQSNSMTYFCKSSYCCIGKQQTYVMKWGRKTKQLGHKKLGTVHDGGMTERGTGRGLLSALLSSGEQKEPQMNIQMFCILILHLQGRKVYCWPVCGGCGQWWSVHLRNSQTGAVDNHPPSDGVILFCFMFYVFCNELTQSCSLSLSHSLTLCPSPLSTVILWPDLPQFLQYLSLHIW